MSESQQQSREPLEADWQLARGIAHRFCFKYNIRGADEDDAEQEACLGVLRAARDYDPNHPRANWKGLLVRNVVWKLWRWYHELPAFHTSYHNRREPRPSRIRMDSAPVVTAAAQEADPATGLFLQELTAALARLPDAERDLLESRYGFRGDEQTLEELARNAGRTRQAICARQKKAESKLRRLMGCTEKHD